MENPRPTLEPRGGVSPGVAYFDERETTPRPSPSPEETSGRDGSRELLAAAEARASAAEAKAEALEAALRDASAEAADNAARAAAELAAAKAEAERAAARTAHLEDKLESEADRAEGLRLLCEEAVDAYDALVGGVAGDVQALHAQAAAAVAQLIAHFP